MSNKIGIFSFFAGAGFLDLGFEMTGQFETLFVNEFHKPFMEVYKYAHKNLRIETPMFGETVQDITTYLEPKNSNLLKEQISKTFKYYIL